MGRGLKREIGDCNLKYLGVAPHGAWIETTKKAAEATQQAAESPRMGRGLKL